MSESKASRTLVKSPPELWSEVSSAASLQRHMDQFGEIRITKLEPETAVAWEGEHARGTITLEPSGWGTKVILTAEPVGPGAQDGADPEAVDDVAEPADRVDPQPATETGGDPAYQAVQAEIRELFLEGDGRRVEIHKRRWPQRLARALRRWLGPPPREDAEPVAPAQGWVALEPEQPAMTASEPQQLSSTPAQAMAEPEPSVSTPAPAPVVEPAPQPRAPSGPETAPTAALDAALDSLGQAHHRPFSRA